MGQDHRVDVLSGYTSLKLLLVSDLLQRVEGSVTVIWEGCVGAHACVHAHTDTQGCETYVICVNALFLVHL